MSDWFTYRDGGLHVEEVPLREIAAEFGTPAYVYSAGAIESAYRAFDGAFSFHPHLICYAVKANSNLAVLELLVRLGSGFDIVSGGELERVLRAGADPRKVVFSGVGKQVWEIERALVAEIACFNVESIAEVDVLEQQAQRLGRRAPVSVRVNPDVDAGTHPYIATGLAENKFGVPRDDAIQLYRRINESPQLDVVGIDCHIGSQITDLAPLTDALTRVLSMVDELEGQGIGIDHIDLGGGLGVRYHDEEPIAFDAYAAALRQIMGRRSQRLIFEPGRAIVAPAGILLTQVQLLKQTKSRNFAVVDAAMNDLLRPSLYNAWQEVRPVTPHDRKADTWDIVGPICETGDFLAKDRELGLVAGDLLSIEMAGAYGFTMSSNYNARGRPPEVLVSGSQAFLVRQRESIEDQLALERGLPDDMPIGRAAD